MMAQPNLIRRPVLVKNGRAIFGFDREQYQKLVT